MKLIPVPKNAYTHSPEQHRNFFVGAFQLLFWMFFRETAWRRHLDKVDPVLPAGESLWVASYWLDRKFFKFLLQVFFLIPLLTTFVVYLIPLGVHLSSSKFPLIHELWNPEKRRFIEIVTSLLLGAAGSAVTSISGGIVGGAFGGYVLGLMALNVSGEFLESASINVGIGIFGSILWDVFGIRLYTRLRAIFFSISIGLLVGFLLNDVVLGFTLFLAYTVRLWRPFLIAKLSAPLHQWIYEIDRFRVGEKPSLLRYHLAFWDELQFRKLKGLDDHLLRVLEKSPLEGKEAFEYLLSSNQRWAAVDVQIKLDSNRLKQCSSIEEIQQRAKNIQVGRLGGDANSLFSLFQRLGREAGASIQQPTTFNQRWALEVVSDHLEATISNLNRSNERYAPTFQPVARQWYEIINQRLERLNKEVELLKELDNPYVFGVPLPREQLSREQVVFTGRTDIAIRLEQLILDRRRPPLLLYGQRRMGKTSLLNNLGHLLPSGVISLFVDFQGPISNVKNEISFFYNLARSMIDSAQYQGEIILPLLDRKVLLIDPFTVFDEWLTQVEVVLGDDTILLALDEFEALDIAFEKGNLDEFAILGFLRHLIQHRPRFKVLISGSHTLKEFQRWASYLINAQTVEIGYLTVSETRKLIENPIPNFSLRYNAGASDRACAITRGHPALTQLLCSEIVNLKNEQSLAVRLQATVTDVDIATQQALQSGSTFFLDLEQNQITAQGTISGAAPLLRHLAAQGESIPSPDGTTPAATLSHSAIAQHFAENIAPTHPEANFDSALEICLRRDVIETVADASGETHYKFQVELIRRWFLR